ncbi:MAG TPA: hypothetical protein VEU32_00745 [Burkholderiales bacterium]|nr:hypothetical protein [Burkholderiales bacterium]
MRKFYVRPARERGYGRGDGTSYENAWNGFESVNWDALAGEPATLWVCGTPEGPAGFVTLHVEWSYLKANEREARPDPRRESSIAV